MHRRQLLATAAREAGHPEANAEAGPWQLGLDYPRYGPFLQFSERRELREQLFRAAIGRAARRASPGLTTRPNKNKNTHRTF